MSSPERTVLEHLEQVGVDRDRATTVRAPGRIDVLGSHTEYNGGLVLAATIERYVWAAGVLSESSSIHSGLFDETVNFDHQNQTRTQSTHWHDYVRGVMWAFERRKHQIAGLTAAVAGDIPMGEGLGSSAALEIAVTNLIANLNGLSLPPKALAMIAFESERLFCGASCSIMDQFTSQLSRPDSLLAVHCATMQTGHVTFGNDLSLLIIRSGIADSMDLLRQRQDECRSALIELQKSGWNISAIGQIKPDELQMAEGILDSTLADRVEHVVRETERVRKGITTLREGDIHGFGKLMHESHLSTRELYEIPQSYIDSVIDTANEQEGVLGTRPTGVGGGETLVSIVKDRFVEPVAKTLVAEYEAETNRTATWFATKIPGGVKVFD